MDIWQKIRLSNFLSGIAAGNYLTQAARDKVLPKVENDLKGFIARLNIDIDIDISSEPTLSYDTEICLHCGSTLHVWMKENMVYKKCAACGYKEAAVKNDI
jgi:hypothetical protein